MLNFFFNLPDWTKFYQTCPSVLHYFWESDTCHVRESLLFLGWPVIIVVHIQNHPRSFFWLPFCRCWTFKEVWPITCKTKCCRYRFNNTSQISLPTKLTILNKQKYSILTFVSKKTPNSVKIKIYLNLTRFKIIIQFLNVQKSYLPWNQI